MCEIIFQGGILQKENFEFLFFCFMYSSVQFAVVNFNCEIYLYAV
jgi:hypothetical protein